MTKNEASIKAQSPLAPLRSATRIKGHILSQADFPVGRLTPMGENAHYDSASKIAEFLVPSRSKPGRVYGVEVDMITTEIACACEHYEYRVQTAPWRDQRGSAIENISFWVKRLKLLPSVLRTPSGLCQHCVRVRSYLVRHGQYALLEQIAAVHISRMTVRQTPDDQLTTS